MRYSSEHKAQTREKLLASSGALAKRGGFAATGVDGLMKAIGLTGGAFYGHFASKDELFAAIVERELSHSVALLGTGEGGQDKLRRCLDIYLNMKHVEQPDSGCALPTLGPEIARAGLAVREQTEHWLVRLQQAWGEELQDPQLAWALLAQCVGALVVARMLASPARQEEVLAASRTLIEAQLPKNPQEY
ncbi:TetR/AcrR family transcriptional regulator [Pseudomonas sp. Gutcm_11s]|uniref:TetR/AcrR family transcriptional regulator n=1 Tax=Pseudomonas sp. Gutcm_11s TaxID=3026088 RepID=UPI00235F99D2|nr:TetR/AcrR family transcriptional regulator [Pseudomonas sp. Gutcm_11s]MDD0845015.1 TetR/AcrR family transcriptional regulator [Pseudomonas sp. Gutcm_11s]